MTETKFFDLPEAFFPFTVECLDQDTGDLLWKHEVSGPGGMVIPAKPEHVREVRIRITYSDGVVVETK